MEEIGTVIDVQGQMAQVKIVRRASCEKCGVCGLGDRPAIVVEVVNTAKARPGNIVRLAMEDGNVLRAAAAAYGVPLLALIAGYVVTDQILGRAGIAFGREGLAIVGGMLALVLSGLWLRFFDRRSAGRFAPRMTGIVGQGNDSPDFPDSLLPR